MLSPGIAELDGSLNTILAEGLLNLAEASHNYVPA